MFNSTVARITTRRLAAKRIPLSAVCRNVGGLTDIKLNNEPHPKNCPCCVRYYSQSKVVSSTLSSRSFGTTLDAEKPFEKVADVFPGSKTNAELVATISSELQDAGFDLDKVLVATSLCCDEVNRPLESVLAEKFTSNFNFGGLAGMPHGGSVAFGAMAAHIPDGGSTLVLYGPHVGVDSAGNVGTVERRGRAEGGSCCGSAVAASNYVSSVLKGDAEQTCPDDIIDAQQYFVGKSLLPHAERLEKAEDKMVELPYALYDAQSEQIAKIVSGGAGGVPTGQIAVLGGIQINTPPGYSDYFMPLSFEIHTNNGDKKSVTV